MAGLVVGVLLAALGWYLDNIATLAAGVAAGSLFYLVASCMEIYCRRYVTALDIEIGELVITTKSITGSHRIRDYASIGERRHDRGFLEQSTAARLSLLTDSLTAMRASGIDNQYHLLEVGPRKKKYILDVSADRQAGDNISAAIGRLQNEPRDIRPETVTQPNILARLSANTSVVMWALLNVALVFFVAAWITVKIEGRFVSESKVSAATITEKSQKRAGADGRGVMEYFISYSFKTHDGKTVKSGNKVGQAFQERLNIGDEIPINYFPSDPWYNVVEFSKVNIGSEVLKLFGGIFLAVGLFFLIGALVRTFTGNTAFMKSFAGIFTLIGLIAFAGSFAFGTMSSKLLGDVLVTEARIIEKKELPSLNSHNGKPAAMSYQIVYSYTDGSGKEKIAAKNVPVETYLDYAKGETIMLQYAGDSPALHDIKSSPNLKAAVGFLYLGWLFAFLALLSLVVRLMRARQSSLIEIGSQTK